MEQENRGYAQIDNGVVYYVHGAPSDHQELRDELKVIGGFLSAWITDTPVYRGILLM